VKGVTPPGGLYRLRVPAGTGTDIHAALMERKSAAGPAHAATRGDVHVVRSHDTVSGIAKRYGITIADVRRWNNLATGDRIRPGDRLIVAAARLSAVPSVQPAAR
jgi:membrane-bound lytic murein transglycosylase D